MAIDTPSERPILKFLVDKIESLDLAIEPLWRPLLVCHLENTHGGFIRTAVYPRSKCLPLRHVGLAT